MSEPIRYVTSLSITSRPFQGSQAQPESKQDHIRAITDGLGYIEAVALLLECVHFERVHYETQRETVFLNNCGALIGALSEGIVSHVYQLTQDQ